MTITINSLRNATGGTHQLIMALCNVDRSRDSQMALYWDDCGYSIDAPDLIPTGGARVVPGLGEIIPVVTIRA